MESKIGKNFSAVIKNGEISSSYRGLFQSQNYLIVLLDKKGNFIYVNKLFCQIFGKSLSELRGKSCCSIFSPDDLNKNYKEVKKSLESEPFRVNVEQRVKTINGWKWLDWEIYGVYENEKFIGIRAIGNNKTDLKMTENMTDVIFQIDLNYEFQYVTPSVKRLLGFKPEYFYGKHIKD
ncbi:MAG: PAS domain-containing protein, partial [Halanaerobiales bacterium]